MKKTVYWTESELKSRLGNNATAAGESYLLNIDLILFDTRLRAESLGSLLSMVGRLRTKDQRQRQRLINNLESILVDTRLSPDHTQPIIELLRELRDAQQAYVRV